jgi:class 3 adenylate cyclase
LHERRLHAVELFLGGQILISQRTLAEVEDEVEVEEAGTYSLKGFARPVPVFNVLAMRF